VTNSNLIAELIANSHRAQIIHQNGLLIYANTAAARVFGFGSISDFAKFAKSTKLFVSGEVITAQPRTRTLNFVCIDGHQKSANIKEQRIDWNGSPSTLLEVALVEGSQNPSTDLDLEIQCGDNETFILDTMSSAVDWTRKDGGQIEIVRQPFDAAGAVFQFSDDLEHYAADCAVSLNVEITPRAQKIFAGDAARFARAGTCMVRHAIERVLGGRVDIVLKADEKGEHLMLEVCDNGMPYKPSDPNVLFEVPEAEVSRLSTSTLEPYLNLPLARCIARHLGGEVGLRVNYPHGGLIRMRLPFPEVDQAHNTLRCTGQRHRKLDILVVEDNQNSQQVIKIILETLGHRPTMVNNGKECLDILKQASFDLIFMDLHMPVHDGYAATQSIRAREQSGVLLYNKPMPILAITADRRPETRAKAIAHGVTGFLTKPVHVPQIMSALAPFIEEIGNPSLAQPNLKMANLKMANLKLASRGA
jgi:CheY-like chemotaxis protein